MAELSELQKQVEDHEERLSTVEKNQLKYSKDLEEIKGSIKEQSIKNEESNRFLREQNQQMFAQNEKILDAVFNIKTKEEEHRYEFKTMAFGKWLALLTIAVSGGGIITWLIQKIFYVLTGGRR